MVRQRSSSLAHVDSAAEISCRETVHEQVRRQAGEEAPDHGESRDRSIEEPIFHGQP